MIDPLTDVPSSECEEQLYSSAELEIEYCDASLPTLYQFSEHSSQQFWVVLAALPPRIRDVVKRRLDDKKGPKFNSKQMDSDAFEKDVHCVCFMESRYVMPSSVLKDDATAAAVTLIEYTEELKTLLKINKFVLL